MDESRAAECCICHHTSDWFYDDISVLQSKHSQRSIRVVLKLIMGEELIQDWAASNTMCFECVDKINDYDEAFEKMQSIERELKQIYQSIDVKIETEDGTVYGVSTVAESNEHDTEQFDANHLSENFYDPLHARYQIKWILLLLRFFIFCFPIRSFPELTRPNPTLTKRVRDTLNVPIAGWRSAIRAI